MVGGAAVRAQERRFVLGPEADRAFVLIGGPALQQSVGGRTIKVAPLALAHRPLVEVDAQPLQISEDPCFRALLGPRGVRVVDSQDESAVLLVREMPVRDRRERAPEVKGTGRARGEANPHHAPY